MKRDLQILKALITEMQSGDCCTECGGAMYEGMCTECGYMEEKLTYTDEYDDNPELKGRQSKLPDQLQKAIIKKGTNEDSNSRGKETDDAINSSELNMLKNIYKNTDPSKIPARHVERMKELEAMLGITKLPTDYAGNPSIPVEEEHEGADHEVSMANNSIDSILWAANELKKHLQGGERDIPAWIQDHITNAENYILQAAKNYHEYGSEEAPEDEPTPNQMSLQEMVKKVGKKYNVYSKKGKKLGSHPSKKKAQKQMAAIEISKQGK